MSLTTQPSSLLAIGAQLASVGLLRRKKIMATGKTLAYTPEQVQVLSSLHLTGPDAPDAGDTILSTRDEAKVLEELVSAQNKSHVLGLALNVPSETLVGIKSQNDPKERLDDVIREFLRGDNPLPTWRVIAGALRRRSVGMSGLALHIERKYCGIVPLQPKSFRPQHSRNRTYYTYTGYL